MSVLLVTDDADDDIPNDSLTNQQEYLYKQLKDVEYDFSSSVRSFSIVESSSSIIVKSNKHYRRHRRRRRCRPQPCLVQHLLTYMLTLLFLTNHLHWSVIFLSLSSIKFMSIHASSSTTTPMLVTSSNQIATKRPLLTPSTARILFQKDEQQCLPITGSQIDRICSKTCRARKTPFEQFDNIDQLLTDIHYLPFCSNYLLNRSIGKENFFSETTESECREILNQRIANDEEARKASALFATYMQAIDSASAENRYSIITADCQLAYRTWACSVTIPYFQQNHLIPPCQTICDEVERVCPTFRPSDREPLFAGQPLLFCDGGIVANSDYGHRPHCFDTCHLFGGSLQRHSVLSSSSLSNKSSSPLQTLAENTVTTPLCFDIEPLSPSPSEQITSPLIYVNDTIYNTTSNTSLSASAITILSSSWSSIILTFLFVLRLKLL